ncbi:MAG TPA: GNAT family N-acetyltransferase [Pyrinomonadaceae bacterium]|nr:GNAT family N-acetyltransferase [Pyrinomonadaceae bacterium]
MAFDAAPNGIPQLMQLEEQHRNETLAFLSTRILHTFVMTGWLHDNGMVNPLNRGTFYGHRNHAGELDGVALIGHTTLFEARSDEAVAAFAGLTQECSAASALMGEEKKVKQFLNYYISGRPAPRLACREQLFEQRHKQQLGEEIPGLRLATTAELDLVTSVHAQLAKAETGVNPLDVDPNGFRMRCARRVHQDRVWVNVQDGQLLFKADVITQLPEVTYLEGVYVAPEQRGNGFGASCMRQLTNHLLDHSKSVCLLIKEQNAAASACYRKAGYQLREYYETLFFQRLN